MQMEPTDLTIGFSVRQELRLMERERELAGEDFDNSASQGVVDWLAEAQHGECGSLAHLATLAIIESAIRYIAWPCADRLETLGYDVKRLRDIYIDQKRDGHPYAAQAQHEFDGRW